MEIEKRIYQLKDGSYDERYHKKGDIYYWHREDGPALIGYYEDGSIYSEGFWINNDIHREDGPAVIYYNKDGSIKYEEYWVNDIELTKEDWYNEFGWKLKLKGTPMEKIFLT